MEAPEEEGRDTYGPGGGGVGAYIQCSGGSRRGGESGSLGWRWGFGARQE